MLRASGYVVPGHEVGAGGRLVNTGYGKLPVHQLQEFRCTCTASRLAPYFTALREAQRGGTAAVAMNMWESYRMTLRAHILDADAKIVFGKSASCIT